MLDNLAKHGLADDTLVIVTSDNGPPFINAKTTLYDSGCNLPFFVRDPRLVRQGVKDIVNPNMVSFIDILPTMLDFAGLPLDLRTKDLSPPRLGKSFLPVLHRTDVVPEAEWPHHIFGSHTFHERPNYYPTRVIRTRRYKYHRNIAWRLDFPFAGDLYCSLSFEGMRNASEPVFLGKRPLTEYIFRQPEHLYDLEKDPLEVTDVAKNPEYAEVLKSLRTRLETWQRDTEDIWYLRDGQSMRGLEGWINKDPMQMPDRFDFDAEHPSLHAPGVGLFDVKYNPNPMRGSTLYSGKPK